MKDEDKTKEQLINELEEMRQRISELERLEVVRKQAEKALNESEMRFRRMVNAVTPYTYSVEIREGQAISTWHSIECLGLTGYTPEDYENDPYLWYSMIYHDDRIMVDKVINEILVGHEVPPTEHRLNRRDGTVVWVRNTMVPHCDDTGQLVRYDGLIEDITVRKRMEEELRILSIRDELTGLYNRRGFLTLAEQQAKIANRLKRGMVVFFGDLDGMKWINDNLGHQEGDQALVDIATLLKKTFRESDIIARIGGDEFVVLAMDTDGTCCDLLSARLTENLNSHNAKEDRPYRLALSIGIAYYNPASPCSIDELLTLADKLMYEQKRKKEILSCVT